MTSIWLVTGEEGEYSDRNTWIVRAYPTKRSAEGFLGLLRAAERAASDHAAQGLDCCAGWDTCPSADVNLDPIMGGRYRYGSGPRAYKVQICKFGPDDANPGLNTP